MHKIVRFTIFPFIIGISFGYSIRVLDWCQIGWFLKQPLIIPIYSSFVGVGVTFFATWLRDVFRQKKERKHILQLLLEELINISESADNNFYVIEGDKMAALEGRQILSPLLLLPTDNWISIRLRNREYLENIFQLRDLVTLYEAVSRVNDKIRNRNKFNLQNQALSGRIKGSGPF